MTTQNEPRWTLEQMLARRDEVRPRGTEKLSDCCRVVVMTDDVMDWCRSCRRVSVYRNVATLALQSDPAKRPLRDGNGRAVFSAHD